ncbi:F-box protein At5g10340-like [Lolium perenne]|uniref:F-box protein At5g10340-like n=1 Tax=Lolium perenne TaxID=4522 RepID=UPI0021F63374|nr:putative F-box protein At1g47765 [Lolium perenne]
MGIMLSSLRCCSSSVASVTLPHDVIFDILSWLPVKSLCRFRCVSREWQTLISDPAFVAVLKSRVEPLLAVDHSKVPSLRLMDMDGNVVRVINDVGWFLTSICIATDDHVCVIGDHGNEQVARIIDLATKKVLVTCLKGRTQGFGRAAPSGAYKVVCLGDHICEVLTVGDGVGWRHKEPHPTNASYRNRPVVVNGVLHLLVAPQPDGDIILCFDLESEDWKKGIKGPPNVKLQDSKISLGELNGALCMAQGETNNTYSGCTNIWILRDLDKSIWVKKYTIPLDSAMYYRMTPLRVLRGDRKLLFYLRIKMGGERVLKIYDPCYSRCADALKTLEHHSSSISICSLNLEHF